MWLLLLRKYWQQLAIVIAACVTVAYFHHSWYSQGYSAAKAEIVKQHDADLDHLAKAKDKAVSDLQAAEQALAKETAAKDAAIAAASKAPKVLTKKVYVHDQTCPDVSIGDDFERVWNAQSEAAGSHK